LKLDCSKARSALGWRPRWDLDTAIARVVDWTRVYRAGGDVRAACERQVAEYAAGGTR
jgi:CDP-glucose 4,6-dehydratase